MFSVSATMPWPAKAASPWIRMGRPRDPAAVGDAVLLGAHAPLHHGVHPFQVAGVERQRDVHPPAGGHAIAGVAEVVLHVAAIFARQIDGAVQELGEDLRRRLAQHVGQHVQAAPVGHADDDLGDAAAGGALDDPVHDGDGALRPLQREPLGPQELGLQEVLEHLGLDHLGQQLQLLGPAQVDPVAGGLDPLLHPAPDLHVVDVGQLDSDVAAVGLFQQVAQLAQLDRPAVGDALDLDHVVQVGLGQAVVLQADPSDRGGPPDPADPGWPTGARSPGSPRSGGARACRPGRGGRRPPPATPPSPPSSRGGAPATAAIPPRRGAGRRVR